MNKCIKVLLITIAIIAVIAGVIYFITKKTGCCELEDDDLFDDDFELDEDLKATTDREYVPLNKTPKEDDNAEADSNPKTYTTPSPDPILKVEKAVVELADKANDKAADIFAKATHRASDIADIANDKVSDFMNKTSDIIKNEKDYAKEDENLKEEQ